MIGFVVFGPGVRQHIKVGAAGRVLTSSQKTEIEREEGWSLINPSNNLGTSFEALPLKSLIALDSAIRTQVPLCWRVDSILYPITAEITYYLI